MSLDYKIAKMIVMGEDPYKLVLSESKIINETYRYLIESVVNWNYIQIQLIKDITNLPETQTWGHGFDTEGLNWSSYDPKSKTLMLMKFFDKTGVLKKLRDYVNSTDKVVRIGTNEYDIKDISNEFRPFSNEFLKDLRESEVYKVMIGMCIDALKTMNVH
ncbi:hypothetical protein CCP1ISM_90031 [Azospirillaceae bacterium]